MDAYYYCPHHPDGSAAAYARTCARRRPGRGLVDKAAVDLGLDPAQSFFVGDKWSGVQAGRSARTILVRTALALAQERQPAGGGFADAVVDNLAAAAAWILITDINNPRV